MAGGSSLNHILITYIHFGSSIYKGNRKQRSLNQTNYQENQTLLQLTNKSYGHQTNPSYSFIAEGAGHQWESRTTCTRRYKVNKNIPSGLRYYSIHSYKRFIQSLIRQVFSGGSYCIARGSYCIRNLPKALLRNEVVLFGLVTDQPWPVSVRC